MDAMKTFANPGIDVVKTLPEGIVELVLRGAAIVSGHLIKFRIITK